MSRPHAELGFHRVAVMLEDVPPLMAALVLLEREGWRLVDGGMRRKRNEWINNWDILATAERYRVDEAGDTIPF